MRFAVVGFLIVSACAGADPPAPQMFWWHIDQTEDRRTRDRYECLREANLAAPASQQLLGQGGYRVGDFWIPPNVSSFDSSSSRRLMLGRLCIEARGWRHSSTDPFEAHRRSRSPAPTAQPRTRQVSNSYSRWERDNDACGRETAIQIGSEPRAERLSQAELRAFARSVTEDHVRQVSDYQSCMARLGW